jgi:hypothetical protein
VALFIEGATDPSGAGLQGVSIERCTFLHNKAESSMFEAFMVQDVGIQNGGAIYVRARIFA